MVNLSSRLSLPARLKSSSSVNNQGASTSPSAANSEFPSRSTSPKPQMGDSKNGTLVLRTSVLKGRNLAAKDKSGTSDPVSQPESAKGARACGTTDSARN